MKAMKKTLCVIVAVALMVTMVPNTVIAKTHKTYKTKTVKVTEGKKKAIKTKKKVKKVKKCSKNKKFNAYVGYNSAGKSITKSVYPSKKFYVSGTDYGKKQAVKVTYTDGSTQKFNIKTVPKPIGPYEKKVVNEVKALLANPDEGLKTIVRDWMGRTWDNGRVSEIGFTRDTGLDEGTSEPIGDKSIQDENDVEEAFRGYSDSEKKAFIISAYVQARSSYNATKKYWGKCKGKESDFKALYNGTFKGACGDGAVLVNALCKRLGLRSVYICCMDIDHGWACIYVKNIDGKPYWMGIKSTAYGYNMKASAPISKDWARVDLSKKQLKKYMADYTDNLILTTLRKSYAK